MAAPSSVKQSVSVKKIWPKEVEADLIEEVRKKEHLWNTKHTYYTKKTLKRVAYEEIALNLANRWPDHSTLFDTDIVLQKFESLRSSYKRELKKMKILKSGSAGFGFTPKWIHFASMSFLEDTVQAEESTSNLDCSQQSILSNIDEHESDCALDIEDEEDEPQIVIENEELAVPGCSKEAPTNSRKRKHDLNDELIKEAGQLLKKLNTTDAEDAYGQFIVSMLNEIIDPKKRYMARIEIQELLLRYIYE